YCRNEFSSACSVCFCKSTSSARRTTRGLNDSESILKVRLAEICLDEVPPAEVRLVEVRLAEICLGSRVDDVISNARRIANPQRLAPLAACERDLVGILAREGVHGAKHGDTLRTRG